MNEAVKARSKVPFKDIIRDEVNALPGPSDKAKAELAGIIDILPLAYGNVPAIFRSLEQKTPGAGGLFSIFVSDLCKGCGECVQVCGDHDALRMTRETED
jgi:pyruvate-ferredoxin/flavodoxin oxidoreductase